MKKDAYWRAVGEPKDAQAARMIIHNWENVACVTLGRYVERQQYNRGNNRNSRDSVAVPARVVIWDTPPMPELAKQAKDAVT